MSIYKINVKLIIIRLSSFHDIIVTPPLFKKAIRIVKVRVRYWCKFIL